MCYSKICLVDLAGSEQLQTSGAIGAQRNEAIAVNLSLTTLNKVIRSLIQVGGVAEVREGPAIVCPCVDVCLQEACCAPRRRAWC